MNKMLNFTLALLLAFPLLANSNVAPHWKVINEEKGITVYSKTIEGSPIFAFKGHTVMDASVGKIMWVLMDNDHRTEWVDRLKVTQVLENVSPFEWVLYQEFGLPWPISNRDFVYRAKVTREADTGKTTLTLISEEHPKSPPTIGVRAQLHKSSYILTPVEDGKTMVEVEIQSDPKGMLPVWLANLIQKKWPIKTLNGIKEQVAKEYVKEAPLP